MLLKAVMDGLGDAAAGLLARLAADLRRTAWDIVDPAPTPSGKANETSPTATAA